MNRLWLAGQRGGHRAFRAALDRPAAVQSDRLRATLARNAGSDYGRRFGFARISTVREYQDAVPVVRWDDLAPWIDAIRAGRSNVLTAEPVMIFETTGGSTGGAKYIPYTRALLEEFRRALAAWICDLYDARPALRTGGAYWSVSPLARPAEVTTGGIAVGFADDAQYFGPMGRRVLRHLFVTPPELAAVEDMAASRYVTLRFLLDTQDLTFVSVWNPSFLTLLMRELEPWTERLIDDIEAGTVTPPTRLPREVATAFGQRLSPQPTRAETLRARLGRDGRLRPTDAWPRLTLISCWTSGAAARFLPELEATFPGVEVQGKGLLATEGVVSIPLVGRAGGAVALTSHFYEFADVEALDQRPRLVHELESGRLYSVILTTGGGLYRYALDDIVAVLGHTGATPLVEFIRRGGVVSDLCGEKLAEAHVTHALDAALARLSGRCAFVMLAPELAAPPYYTLFAELPKASDAELAGLAADVDRLLQESPTYAYCRRLGQLGAVRAFRVHGAGARAYLARCVKLGQRSGAVKATVLHAAPGWTSYLPGALV